MDNRSKVIECIRGEVVGPSRWHAEPHIANFNGRIFSDDIPFRQGGLAWRPEASGNVQEVLYFDRETPHRKYGAGLLHPGHFQYSANTGSNEEDPAAVAAANVTDFGSDSEIGDEVVQDSEPNRISSRHSDGDGEGEDFEVSNADVRCQTTMGISFCAHLPDQSSIRINLPHEIRSFWQEENSAALQTNGRYESCQREWISDDEETRTAGMWRRYPAVPVDCHVVFNASEFRQGRTLRTNVDMPEGSPIQLSIELFPRRVDSRENVWLVTVVLRNTTPLQNAREPKESILYQSYFECVVNGGELVPYPESTRPVEQMDTEERALRFL